MFDEEFEEVEFNYFGNMYYVDFNISVDDYTYEVDESGRVFYMSDQVTVYQDSIQVYDYHGNFVSVGDLPEDDSDGTRLYDALLNALTYADWERIDNRVQDYMQENG